MSDVNGFFVDWDGNIRRFEHCGDGLESILVARGPLGIDVFDSGAFVIRVATFFPTLEAVVSAGAINPV